MLGTNPHVGARTRLESCGKGCSIKCADGAIQLSNPSYIVVGCLSNVLGRRVSSASLLSGEALTDQRVRPYKVFTEVFNCSL